MASGAGRPRVFISHASEDKSRFVLPFATRLEKAGIDTWVDQWEIRLGDSLVQRIFAEGIEASDALIAVLSDASINKPWVREELDSAFVKRIESNQSFRIIPVVIDEKVNVPAPLRHLLWVSVPQEGFDGAARRVADTLFNRTAKPSPGPAPGYQSTPLKWTSEPADEAVFNLLVDELRSHDGPGWLLRSGEVQERALGLGIDTPMFRESMAVLMRRHLVNAKEFANGKEWILKPFPDRIWLELEQLSGVNLDELRLRLLSIILNEKKDRLMGGDLNVGWHTLGALLREFQNQGLLNVSSASDGTYYVSNVSPVAYRVLRQST